MDTQYIHNIIIDNIKQRYITELEYVETEEEKNEIKKILQKYNKISEKKIDIFDNKMNEIELLTMKKLFYRLKEPQKINRLKPYFIEKYNLSNEEATKNAEQIIELLNSDMLKNKDINYDVDNIKVIDIKNIDFDNSTKMIKIIKLIKSQKSVKNKKTKTAE